MQPRVSIMFFDDWYGIARVAVATVVGYAALVLILRMTGKRTLSKLSAFDLVVTVALGSTLATLILSDQVAIVEGVVAFAMLALLQLVVAWAATRSRRVRRLLKSEPTLLFFRGSFLEEALDHERVTRDEVRGAVREEGIAQLDTVEAVVLEPSGRLAVVRRQEGGR